MTSSIDYEQEDADIFLPYRDRIVYSLAVASLLIFSPFAVSSLMDGHWLLGGAATCIVGLLIFDAAAIYGGKPLPVPLWVLVFPVIGGLVATMLIPLYMGLAWTYPALVLFCFILPPRLARLVAALLVSTVAVLCWLLMPVEHRWRVGSGLVATMALTAVLGNIFLGIISDLQRQLRRQTIVDPLTEAYNRRHMDTVLKEAFARAARGTPPPSLLVMDIDHFKRINDQCGHAVGDTVLRKVTDIARHEGRATDKLFRCGGEEFVLYLPETDAAGARVVAEEIRRAIAGARLLDTLPVTVSIGVSTLRPDDSLDDWIRCGDQALYCAKESGRNRVCLREAAAAPASASD